MPNRSAGQSLHQLSCPLGLGRVLRRKNAERVRQPGLPGPLHHLGHVLLERVVG